MNNIFEHRKNLILSRYEELVTRKNEPIEGNGVYERYKNPVVTAEMAPPFWRYDFNEATNPYFEERIGVNATLNSGAIKWGTSMYLWCASKEVTASRFSLLPRVPTVSTISASGTIRSRCPKMKYRV